MNRVKRSKVCTKRPRVMFSLYRPVVCGLYKLVVVQMCTAYVCMQLADEKCLVPYQAAKRFLKCYYRKNEKI